VGGLKGSRQHLVELWRIWQFDEEVVVAKRRWQRITPEVRREVIRLARGGASYRDIKGKLDLPVGSIGLVLRPLGGVLRREQWECPSGVRLSLDDRVEIQLGLEHAKSLRVIAGELGRAPSTICREVNHHGGRDGYKAVAAHRAAQRDARRPKRPKLASAELAGEVECRLRKWWSPQEIAAKLRVEFADRPELWVSHETIYKSLYVQGRGELRRELHRCLRTGRAQRRHQSRTDQRGRIPNMVMISERPAEIEDRAVPGHWEGDLIMGANNHSAIGTLVERSTRFVLLLHLPQDRSAEAVRDTMAAKILTLPAALRRSITWDQGKEMTQHAQFTIETGVPIYFCEPHSPWQRGSNENTNGLLRQYFPKGISLRRFTAADLDAAADSLNGRPRETLGWDTPAERLNQLLLQ
jgi:IS30 family transposase